MQKVTPIKLKTRPHLSEVKRTNTSAGTADQKSALFRSLIPLLGPLLHKMSKLQGMQEMGRIK